jgi:two-component system, cell cycle sensor histidine kinase and response regulator CckA
MKLPSAHIKQWFSLAAFDNEDERRSARVLLWLILVSWAVYLLVCIVSWSLNDWRTIAVTFGVIVLQVVPLRLVLRGRLHPSAFIFLLGVLVAVTGMATFGQGIKDIGVVAYPILFVFAGVTLSRRLFLLSIACTLAAVVWLAAGEATGLFETKPLTTPIWVYTVGLVAVLLVAALAVYMLSRDLRRSLEHTRHELAQRERTEEALQQSEERFRYLSSMTSEGIMIHEGGVVLDANQAFARLLGYESPASMIGTPIPKSTPLTPESLERIREHLRSDAADTYEVEIALPDGSIRSAETSSTEVVYRGRQSRLVSVRDITKRKRAEEALRASEEQLRQSQKMEAVGQLAGGIAHDFNNLLSAILGYSQILLDRTDLPDPTAEEDLREIKQAAERASALTRQILAFSRRQALRPTVVSLNDVLDRMEPLLRRTLGEDIELEIGKRPDLWTVEADVHQFEQVIMNMAVNARDAMPTGGRLTMETDNVELDETFCRAYPGSSTGSHVMLRVRDTGAGMDEATRDRVFEPFYTTKAPGAGTGLGLAVAYGIVKQSGGTILVESEPGHGASFSVYLPRSKEAPPDAPSPADEGKEIRGTETILLVEDEAAVRRLATRVLEDLGYHVLSAGTVEEARRLAGQPDTRLDLLLTDVVLPGDVQGNELARDLAASRPHLSILYVSGYPRDALVHAGRLDAGVHLLEKPFGPRGLAVMVRTVLDERRAAD